MKIDPKKALVVFSGGQDSTTCLGCALAEYKEVEAISFHYGQRHAREIEAAYTVRRFFEHRYSRTIVHHSVALPQNTLLSTSPLVDHSAELERYSSHDEMEDIIGDRVELTFVPMRNALFLTIAANYAVARGAGVIITGVCQEDNANYPDCREDFIDSMVVSINTALGIGEFTEDGRFVQGSGLIIETPLMHLSKADTVRLALRMPHTYEALAYSHTAYDNSYPPNGDDHASVLRAHGFEQAGVPDPLILRASKEGLMTLPDTPNYSLFSGKTFKG